VSKQNDATSDGVRSSRLPYHAPQVARIDLRAEEVLASGCKTLKGNKSIDSSSRCITLACSRLDVS
jgi:hypothetical protein